MQPSLLLSLHVIFFVYQNLAYLCAAYYQAFAMSTFFTLYTTYMAKFSSVSLQQIANGSMALGSTAVVGIVAISVTYDRQLDRLIPLVINPIICGVVTLCMTLATNEVSVFNLYCVNSKNLAYLCFVI